jgi:hypothetical protein
MGSESFFIHPILRYLYQIWSVLNLNVNAKAPFLGRENWGVFVFLGYKSSKLSLRLSIFVVSISDKLKEINEYQFYYLFKSNTAMQPSNVTTGIIQAIITDCPTKS